MKYPFIILCLSASGFATHAAEPQPGVSPPSSQKGLAATMEVYAFPQKGQSPAQQSTDESDCYNWATQNTGTNPFQLQKQEQAEQQQSEQAMAAAGSAGAGAGARGAVGGAAGGALIGAIAGDAGKGAAYGAATGLLVGHHRKKVARHQAEASVGAQSAQQQQDIATQLTNFKKAFSVCLEGKNYLVKY